MMETLLVKRLNLSTNYTLDVSSITSNTKLNVIYATAKILIIIVFLKINSFSMAHI